MPELETHEPLSSAAYYFLVAAGGEPASGQGTVITVDPDGGVTSRPYQHLEEARALANVLSDRQHGYREVYLLAQEAEATLYQYRARTSWRLDPFRAAAKPRSRPSALADML